MWIEPEPQPDRYQGKADKLLRHRQAWGDRRAHFKHIAIALFHWILPTVKSNGVKDRVPWI